MSKEQKNMCTAIVPSKTPKWDKISQNKVEEYKKAVFQFFWKLDPHPQYLSYVARFNREIMRFNIDLPKEKREMLTDTVHYFQNRLKAISNKWYKLPEHVKDHDLIFSGPLQNVPKKKKNLKKVKRDNPLLKN